MKKLPEQRPLWQTEACPEWCAGDHKDTDAPVDRFHRSAWSFSEVIALVTDSGGVYVDVEQHVREIGPRVLLVHETDPAHRLSLLPEEAERLAQGLLEAAGLVRGEGR